MRPLTTDGLSSLPTAYPATAPFASLLSVAIGTAFSILLVPPSDYDQQGALVPSAAALTLGLLGGPLVAAIRNRAALFRAENVLMFGLVYWLVLEVLLGRTNQYLVSYEAVAGSLLAIGLFASALWGGSIGGAYVGMFATRRRRPLSVNLAGVQFLFGAAVISGLLGLARYVVGCGFSVGCLSESFYVTRFGAPWLRVDAFGDFDTLFLYSRYFGFIVVPLTAALLCQKRGVGWRGAIALGLSLLCLLFMFRDGGRKDVGTAVGSGVLTWALLQPRFRWKQIVLAGLIGGALLFVMHWMLVWRNVGVGQALDDPGFLQADAERPLITVDGNFNLLSDIVYFVPTVASHTGIRGILYALTLWVPVNLPFVVRTRDIDLPGLIGLQVGPGFSWTCSAVGDLYLIGGFTAVLAGGFLFGLAASSASRRFLAAGNTNETIAYGLITMTLFLSLRALHEVFVTGFAVGAFALFVWAKAALRRHAAGGSATQ